jgi:glycosyltransferase involved in cell wall biosynthesis
VERTADGPLSEERSWLNRIARGETQISSAWSAELAGAVAGHLSTSPPPSDDLGDLVARPCRVPAVTWHLDRLEEALRLSPEDPVALVRARYHARWLAHLFDPDDPEHQLLVSIVIPVYNDAELLPRAVASCFAQTHRRIEVVVVDDGSTDHPEKALAPFSDTSDSGRRLRVMRKGHRGVASARNTGQQAARGEFVHLLDADDILDPDAVERKLAAFRRVPDAELCCSRSRTIGSSRTRDAATHRGPDFGHAQCPTRDLMDACVHRYAFHTSTVMLPRWVCLEVGPWNEELRHGSDSRYWFRLALRNTKVIALRDQLGTRQLREGSLTTHGWDRRRLRPIVFLMAVVDLLDRPERWTYLGPLLARMRRRARWRLITQPKNDHLARWREALLERIERLGDPQRRDGLSSRLPLILIQEYLLAGTSGGSEETDDFRPRLERALTAALVTAPPVDARDLRFWLGEPADPLPSEKNGPALQALLGWIDAAARRGDLMVSQPELLELVRRAPDGQLARRLGALGRAPDLGLGRWAWYRIWAGQKIGEAMVALRRRASPRRWIRRREDP